MAFHNDIGGKSLLDIGGGIGAIQWKFLENSASKTTDVDASRGYLKVAEEYSHKMNWGEKTEFIMADFNDVSDSIENHDYVTLDKVICCYPDYKKLLSNALTKSNEVLFLSFPIGGIVSKLLSKLSSIYFRFRNNPFRTYIHDPGEVHQFIESKGFQLQQKAISFPWIVRAYQRNS